MSPADKRVSELLDRWLASVELHARYLELDAEAYARVQAWPKHQRPTKWVVDLARARLLDLKRHLTERQARGDTEFAETLELMSFLTTLLGSEHIERFIPLAVPPSAGEAQDESNGAQEPGKTAETSATTVVRPRGERRAVRRPASPRPAGRTTENAPAKAAQPTDAPARAAGPAGSATTPTPTAATAAPAPAPAPDRVAATVIADAVRLLNWGREWPQLAGLIARLADRPSEQEVWRILREHRATIEAQAKPPSG